MNGTHEDGRNATIALLLPTFTPGGIERCMVNLAEGFADRGVDVELLVVDRRGSFEAKVPDGVPIVDLGADRVRRSVVPLITYLRERTPDVLLSGHAHANLVAVWSGKLSRTDTTVAVGVHNTLSRDADPVHDVMSVVVDRLLPITYRHADHVIAVSEGVAGDVVRTVGIPREDVSVIHNPVIGSEFRSAVDEPVSHRWLTDESIEVVLGAGRLAPQKDFGTLVRAFEGVAASNANARLLLVGSGEERETIRRLIDRLGLQETVEIVDYVENLYAVMRAADVFVLSSRWEGFGIVLVEAMAAGTPVVSTDCPHGPSEILANGRFGRLVAVGDVEALSSAIEETLRSDADSAAVTSRAMEFDVRSVAEEYARLLEIAGE